MPDSRRTCQRCIGTAKSGQRCKNRTCRGKHCWQHPGGSLQLPLDMFFFFLKRIPFKKTTRDPLPHLALPAPKAPQKGGPESAARGAPSGTKRHTGSAAEKAPFIKKHSSPPVSVSVGTAVGHRDIVVISLRPAHRLVHRVDSGREYRIDWCTGRLVYRYSLPVQKVANPGGAGCVALAPRARIRSRRMARGRDGPVTQPGKEQEEEEGRRSSKL